MSKNFNFLHNFLNFTLIPTFFVLRLKMDRLLLALLESSLEVKVPSSWAFILLDDIVLLAKNKVLTVNIHPLLKLSLASLGYSDLVNIMPI